MTDFVFQMKNFVFQMMNGQFRAVAADGGESTDEEDPDGNAAGAGAVCPASGAAGGGAAGGGAAGGGAAGGGAAVCPAGGGKS